jgi:hypothetical protein
MKKALHTYFIPSKGNNFKPRFFETRSLLVLLLIAVSFFIASTMIHNRFSKEGGGASQLVELINQTRIENNKSPLLINEKLTEAAQMKVDDMVEKHYVSHVSPAGIDPWFWFNQVHYSFVIAGETVNTIAQSKTIEDVWEASLKDDGHVLDARFREVGLASREGYLEGKPTTFVVELFGAPAEASSSKVLSTITETPSTIIVQNDNAVSAVVMETPLPRAHSSLLLIKSQKYLYYGLLALSVFLAFALVLFIFIEIKKQYPLRILLGTLLLVAILIFAYVTKSYYLISTIN